MRSWLLAIVMAEVAVAASVLPAFAAEPAAPPAAAVTAEQTVLTAAKLIDQRGHEVTLPDGRPWVLTFFYSNCPDVCPTMVYNVTDVEAALPPEVRTKIGFGAISFDPARDTVPRLAEFAENFEMRAANEYLLGTDLVTLDRLVKAFKFDFKPDRNGGFQHTTLTAIMDGKGRILHHFYGLQPDIQRMADVARGLITP